MNRSEPLSDGATENIVTTTAEIVIQEDGNGYEWKTETNGQRWYRNVGSEEKWIKFEY